ncbi:hypothetical protein GCM10010284_67790 [Streptomyces rubiginosohelvolus]|nr:hypothetical protein GCM10010284_67790 [Streptomyces rubiginosohelvolus]
MAVLLVTGGSAVGQFSQPAAIDESDQLAAERFQLGFHGYVYPHYLPDLAGYDRSGGLSHGGEDELIVRRERRLLHARRAVRDRHHRLHTHLPGHRPSRGAFVGELLAHPFKDSLNDDEFVPLDPHLRRLLGHVQRHHHRDRHRLLPHGQHPSPSRGTLRIVLGQYASLHGVGGSFVETSWGRDGHTDPKYPKNPKVCVEFRGLTAKACVNLK